MPARRSAVPVAVAPPPAVAFQYAGLPAAGPSNPVKAFGGYLEALNAAIRHLVHTLEHQRLDVRKQEPLALQEITAAADSILDKLPTYENAPDVVRVALEKALEAMVLNLPELTSGPWVDDDQHFLLYHDTLDVMVEIVERQLVDNTLAMQTIEYLFEAQTVHKAEQLFTYLETRSEVLMKGMIPGKGKALTILRTLNDLLRRASKSTHTVLCGRVRLFLANTFPLGERSGVNLRGDFNKDNVTSFEVETAEAIQHRPGLDEGEEEDDKMIEDTLIAKQESSAKGLAPVEAPEDGEEVEDKLSVIDETAGTAEKKETPVAEADKKRAAEEPDFYTLFWSLQRYFSDPPSLFAQSVHSELPQGLSKFAATFPTVPPLGKDGKVITVLMAAGTPNLTLLRHGVTKMLDVFSDASKRDKALQGAARDVGHKSKKDGALKSASLQTPIEDVKKLFFYPKFLTSKSLIDLEVADSNFRKQAMIQCLILFQYLHSFTEAARSKSTAALKHPNRSVLLPHRLSEVDNAWISDLEARTYIEISRTPPDGEYFVKTVRNVLQGERNWIMWKAELCPQFEKAPLGSEASDKGKAGAKALQRPLAPFPYKAGTPALSKLWLNESKTMEDFVKSDSDAELQRYFEAAKMQNFLIAERKQELADEGKPDAAQQSMDAELQRLEDRKATIAWRALRLASSTHLHLYSKIGVNDVEKLIQEKAKPLPPLPHLGGIVTAPGTPANIKTEEPSDGVPKSEVATEAPPMSGDIQQGEVDTPSIATISIKVEETAEAKAAEPATSQIEQMAEMGQSSLQTETSPPALVPETRDSPAAESISYGKRSRETSGMQVDDDMLDDQNKKQKVQPESSAPDNA